MTLSLSSFMLSSACDASFEHSALNAQSPPHPEQSQVSPFPFPFICIGSSTPPPNSKPPTPLPHHHQTHFTWTLRELLISSGSVICPIQSFSIVLSCIVLHCAVLSMVSCIVVHRCIPLPVFVVCCISLHRKLGDTQAPLCCVFPPSMFLVLRVRGNNLDSENFSILDKAFFCDSISRCLLFCLCVAMYKFTIRIFQKIKKYVIKCFSPWTKIDEIKFVFIHFFSFPYWVSGGSGVLHFPATSFVATLIELFVWLCCP